MNDSRSKKEHVVASIKIKVNADNELKKEGVAASLGFIAFMYCVGFMLPDRGVYLVHLGTTRVLNFKLLC